MRGIEDDIKLVKNRKKNLRTLSIGGIMRDHGYLAAFLHKGEKQPRWKLLSDYHCHHQNVFNDNKKLDHHHLRAE